MKTTILVLLSLCVLVSCKSKPEPMTPKPRLVKVINIGTSSTELQPQFTFISEPRKETNLSFRVGGPLSVFDVEAGTFFKKGATIASLNKRDFQVQLEKAEGSFNQAGAQYRRMKGLYEKKNISKSEFERAKANFVVTRSDFQAAKNALKDTQLLAPFDGYVQEKLVERGQDVRPMETIVRFIDLQALNLSASITEDVARNRQNIDSITVVFDAYPNNSMRVKLRDIASSSNSSNMSYRLTAYLENNNKSLKLLGGMTGNLSIHLKSQKQKQLTIPIQALCNSQLDGTHVWVVTKEHILAVRPVVEGALRPDNRIEITAGLQGDETLVMAGQALLTKGEQVRTTN